MKDFNNEYFQIMKKVLNKYSIPLSTYKLCTDYQKPKQEPRERITELHILIDESLENRDFAACKKYSQELNKLEGEYIAPEISMEIKRAVDLFVLEWHNSSL